MRGLRSLYAKDMGTPNRNSGARFNCRARWRISLVATALTVVALGLVATSILVFLHQPPEVRWVRTQGTVLDTRIVADHASETKWGSDLTWRAEYKVAYSISDHEYSMWSDSGIRGESETAVRSALGQSHPICEVQYNPQKPIAAQTECR